MTTIASWHGSIISLKWQNRSATNGGSCGSAVMEAAWEEEGEVMVDGGWTDRKIDTRTN